MENASKTTALLVMDMQEVILSGLPDPTAVIQNTANCIAHARSENMQIIYVTLGFREGFPEIGTQNKAFMAFKERLAQVGAAQLSHIHPQLLPQPQDWVVTKHRISGFSGSDLDMLLRANKIEHLILSGVATSGVVLSTYTEALDKDYGITVITDACMDRDEEVHQVLTTKIFANRAQVKTTQEWTNSL